MSTLFIKLLIIGFLITAASSMEAQDLRDKNGIRLGTIEDDGDVRDKNSIRLGKAKDMDKKKAAVLFFFSEL